MTLHSLLTRWPLDEVEVDFHSERGDADIYITEVASGDTIAAWHDEDVYGLMEDGFVKWGSSESVIRYADSVGISAYPRTGKRFRAYLDKENIHEFIGSFNSMKEAAKAGREKAKELEIYIDDIEIFVLDTRTMKTYTVEEIRGLFWN